jgi:hypothetical protein
MRRIYRTCLACRLHGEKLFYFFYCLVICKKVACYPAWYLKWLGAKIHSGMVESAVSSEWDSHASAQGCIDFLTWYTETKRKSWTQPTYVKATKQNDNAVFLIIFMEQWPLEYVSLFSQIYYSLRSQILCVLGLAKVKFYKLWLNIYEKIQIFTI